MESMMNKQTLLKIWHRLTTPRQRYEDEARREYAAKVISVVLFGMSCVLILSLGLIVQTPLVFIPITLATLWALSWWLTDLGYLRIGGLIPLLMFFAFALQTNYIEGAETSAILLYVAVIILAAMLQGGIAHWVVLVLSIGAYLGIDWALGQNLLPPPPVSREALGLWQVNVVASLTGITLLQWFYTMQYQKALAQSQARAREAAVFRTLAENATDAIGMTDWQGQFIYVNKAFCRLFDCDDVSDKLGKFSMLSLVPEDEARRLRPIIAEAMHQGWNGEVKLQRQDGTLIDGWLTLFPMLNEVGQSTGAAAIIRDLTALKQAEVEQQRLQQEIIEAQRQALKELSTPIIPVLDQVIVMPLIGSIDTLRAKDITRTLLAGIGQYQAKVVILDITGVPIVDSGVAGHLDKTIQAARLKGARVIVTGISDAVAEAIVDLGLDWSGIETLSNLQTGLMVALQNLGIKLAKR